MSARCRCARPATRPRRWFWDHYEMAAGEVISFLEADGITLDRASRVGDIGCGDGIIDLGVAHRAAPAQLVGFDIKPTDRRPPCGDGCARRDRSELPGLPRVPTVRANTASGRGRLVRRPVHVVGFRARSGPTGLASARCSAYLSLDGVLMLQLWPFFHSQHGSHLWRWFPEGFVAASASDQPKSRSEVRENPEDDPGWGEYMLGEYRALNRITVDELQRCLLAARFSGRQASARNRARAHSPGAGRTIRFRCSESGGKASARRQSDTSRLAEAPSR